MVNFWLEIFCVGYLVVWGRSMSLEMIVPGTQKCGGHGSVVHGRLPWPTMSVLSFPYITTSFTIMFPALPCPPPPWPTPPCPYYHFPTLPHPSPSCFQHYHVLLHHDPHHHVRTIISLHYHILHHHVSPGPWSSWEHDSDTTMSVLSFPWHYGHPGHHHGCPALPCPPPPWPTPPCPYYHFPTLRTWRCHHHVSSTTMSSTTMTHTTMSVLSFPYITTS